MLWRENRPFGAKSGRLLHADVGAVRFKSQTQRLTNDVVARLVGALSNRQLRGANVERANRSTEPLQGQFAGRLDFDGPLDRGEDLDVDEDLFVFRVCAQTRSQVHDRADRAIVVTALKPDAAEGGVAVRRSRCRNRSGDQETAIWS